MSAKREKDKDKEKPKVDEEVEVPVERSQLPDLDLDTPTPEAQFQSGSEFVANVINDPVDVTVREFVANAPLDEDEDDLGFGDDVVVNEEDTAQQTLIEQKPPPWKYNTFTEQSYEKLGFPLPENHPDLGRDSEIALFLQLYDVNRPVERIILTMTRTIPKHFKGANIKGSVESIHWMEEWRGFDYNGNPVPPVTHHIEGQYLEQERKPHIVDGVQDGWIHSGQHPVNYIKFDPDTVNRILAKYQKTGTDIHDVRFFVDLQQGSGSSARSGYLTREQFTNLSWKEIVDLFHKGL